MTTITIENSSLEMPSRFRTEHDLLEFLLKGFEDKTFLVNVEEKDLNEDEKSAYQQHRASGHKNFVDFKG